MTILTEKIRVANKFHACDACYWWDMSNFGEKDVSADDWLIVQAAIADKFKITPGTKYKYQAFVYDGTVQTFKGRIDMDKICHKYDLYPEDEEMKKKFKIIDTSSGEKIKLGEGKANV